LRSYRSIILKSSSAECVQALVVVLMRRERLRSFPFLFVRYLLAFAQCAAYIFNSGTGRLIFPVHLGRIKKWGEEMPTAVATKCREAIEGEDLVVARSPYGFNNWLTEPGKEDCAIYVPCTALLLIEVADSPARGALLERDPKGDTFEGSHWFLCYLDGARERKSLNELPRGTTVRVLRLVYIEAIVPQISLKGFYGLLPAPDPAKEQG
jgi:hypothetical protein